MAKRTMNLYRIYSFKDKDPCVDQLRTIIADEAVSYTEIHERSGVSVNTLWNWFDGPTRRPQHATVMAVVRALGYDYKLVKVGKVLALKKGA